MNEELLERKRALWKTQRELQEELRALEQQAEITKAADQVNFLDQMLATWVSYDWKLEELCAQVATRCPKPSRAKAKVKRMRAASNVIWVDKANPENTYRGRGSPKWMDERMREAGYDPEIKEDRKSFRENEMVKQVA